MIAGPEFVGDEPIVLVGRDLEDARIRRTFNRIFGRESPLDERGERETVATGAPRDSLIDREEDHDQEDPEKHRF